jgi:isopropylmalate/homocitrate/citramalate synthase
MTFLPQVKLVEVGPRDGLQNEAAPIPTPVKAEFIQRLAAAGCREIEATSFVHPARVPQLADAEAVAASLDRSRGTRYSALVPNERGLARALAAGIERIAVFTGATETFTQRNIGMSIDASLATFREVLGQARERGLTARGYVSVCFGCPYEGEVSADQVLRVAAALLDLGVDEVSLGDTIGIAVPTDIPRLLQPLLGQLPRERLALHFHDTSGTALANVLTGLESGITTFDSSAGGLGGCPYAPGAAGNLATEDLVYMLGRMGITTGIVLEAVAEASAFVEPYLSHPLPSRQYQRLKSFGVAVST